ncbi:ATP-dependent DNA helicase DinG [Oleiagrimonas sp.]|jgi:ATP-dependent DNA helicase DinG|uniref:ATP-dependent DNA helicase DinG n=1 Tax=Oleiagrimonas sp. TaxID=2010330 RepID=UPI0026198EBB|nr:ATP-dependent DNA helicase DinG [Oleiagrimonas sp.]MDA3913800.1 ATP-dependent DNA helicase DinG [Oleiagrimonas sp.]
MLSDATKDEIRAAYGRLKTGLPGFRSRRSQGVMVAEVAKLLSRPGGAGAIEAPTGTGKSMAYLIAGHAVAKAQGRKLLIASATVALQEQLVRRDIPQYLAVCGVEARVALAKGRQRYVCPRNLATASGGGGGDSATQGSLGLGEDLALWTRPPRAVETRALETLGSAFNDESWNGDMDAAPVEVPELVRRMVTTSAGGCTGRRCAHFRHCPFFAARRDIADADIIVANQDLVLADLTMPREDDTWGGVILPKPDETLYVFDEAHHMPAKAIDRGASHVHLMQAVTQLNRLDRHLRGAYSLCEKDHIGGYGYEAGSQRLAELGDALEALERSIRLHWTPAPQESEPMWRASLGRIPSEWTTHAQSLMLLTSRVQAWVQAVRRAVAELENGGPTGEALSRELGIALERIGRQLAAWTAWSHEDPQDQAPLARWVSLNSEQQVLCHASAVSAARLLREVLWDNAAAAVMTSATLSAGGHFRGFADAVGLPDDALTLSLPSPFELAKQARLEVPHLDVLPDDREGHAQAVADWLDAHLDWEAGNLVLFTSRMKMQRVLQLLPIDKVRKILAQGSQAKSKLVADHTEAVEAGTGSSLFGLASFGEGLDLPGRLCETVVVTQLPFAVPTDPVGATWAEWLESQGRNPFFEVSLPDATRLLTQYCGRLIRTETDRGRIVLLDRRVVLRRYGQQMLDALPPFTRVIERAATPA